MKTLFGEEFPNWFEPTQRPLAPSEPLPYVEHEFLVSRIEGNTPLSELMLFDFDFLRAEHGMYEDDEPEVVLFKTKREFKDPAQYDMEIEYYRDQLEYCNLWPGLFTRYERAREKALFLELLEKYGEDGTEVMWGKN